MKTAKRKLKSTAGKDRPWVGLPPWELPPWPGDAHKGHCRPLSHVDAVGECAFLSEQYRRYWRANTGIIIEFRKVARALNEQRIAFALTGAYGCAGWTGRPMSTHDVDILVRSGRYLPRAVEALRLLYPTLHVVAMPRRTSLFVAGERESVIDLSIPFRADYEVTFATATLVKDDDLIYRIPALEAALANKYGAMVSSERDAIRRAQDSVDFYTMVKHSIDPGRTPIDLDKLRILGEMVWPSGGGDEIIRLVAEAKAGELPSDPLKSRKANGAKKNGHA